MKVIVFQKLVSFPLQVLSMRLEEVSQTSPIPEEAYTALWESIVRITNRTLLEGFASARRCTNEGRSLMQLDYQVSVSCWRWQGKQRKDWASSR